jgi:hypothetical protein
MPDFFSAGLIRDNRDRTDHDAQLAQITTDKNADAGTKFLPGIPAFLAAKNSWFGWSSSLVVCSARKLP